jgi:hypothetical protein
MTGAIRDKDGHLIPSSDYVRMLLAETERRQRLNPASDWSDAFAACAELLADAVAAEQWWADQ